MDDLRRLQIEWECIRLSNAFAYHLDQRDYTAVAALFTEDGVWIRHGARLKGRAAIIAALEQRPANQFTRHITTGHYFTELSEKSAASYSSNRSYYSLEAEDLPGPFDAQQMLLLDFLDRYALTAEGWRFTERNSALVLAPDNVRATWNSAHE